MAYVRLNNPEAGKMRLTYREPWTAATKRLCGSGVDPTPRRISWSPDGKILACSIHYVSGADEIGTLDLASCGVRTLYHSDELQFESVGWMPDGNEMLITYLRRTSGASPSWGWFPIPRANSAPLRTVQVWRSFPRLFRPTGKLSPRYRNNDPRGLKFSRARVTGQACVSLAFRDKVLSSVSNGLATRSSWPRKLIQTRSSAFDGWKNADYGKVTFKFK